MIIYEVRKNVCIRNVIVNVLLDGDVMLVYC